METTRENNKIVTDRFSGINIDELNWNLMKKMVIDDCKQRKVSAPAIVNMTEMGPKVLCIHSWKTETYPKNHGQTSDFLFTSDALIC